MSDAAPRRIPLPLVTRVAGGVSVAVLTVLFVVAVVLSRRGITRMDLAALLAGLLVGVVAIVVAAAWTLRVTTGLRELHKDAVRRLRDPILRTESASVQWEAVRSSQELLDLARVLDALHLRARVADEVAEQWRRAAENASAGMFELLSGLVAAEEATRGQLSAELHDTVAQSLMTARALLSDKSADNDQVTLAWEYIEEAEEQLRAVMARAKPPELRDGDLASAVSALRRDLHSRYLFRVRFSWPDEPYPLPLVAAVTVYRFYQEALLNVVKHADVEEAEAALLVEGEQLVARVTDKGPGFVPDEVQAISGRHVGLDLLRERARLAGGNLEVETSAGAGTTLTLRLPLSPTSPRIATGAGPGGGADGEIDHGEPAPQDAGWTATRSRLPAPSRHPGT